MARNHWKICNLIQVITGGSTTLNKKHTKKRKPDIPRQAPMINNTNWILPSLWMHRVWASSKCIYTNTHIFAQVSLIVYFAQIWTLLQSKPTHGQHWIQMFQHFVFLVCWCPSTHPKINQQTLAELTGLALTLPQTNALYFIHQMHHQNDMFYFLRNCGVIVRHFHSMITQSKILWFSLCQNINKF